MRNGNYLKSRVSEIGLKQIRVNWGVGVYSIQASRLMIAQSFHQPIFQKPHTEARPCCYQTIWTIKFIRRIYMCFLCFIDFEGSNSKVLFIVKGLLYKLRWQVFDFFWPPIPLRWHFLPYTLTKSWHFWTIYSPPLLL